MDKCLLIGNGLNRTLKNSKSWADVMDGIAKEYGVGFLLDIPFPLEFERIVNSYLDQNSKEEKTIYSDIKSKIADRLSKMQLPSDAVHREIRKLKVNAILTTNYDYLLESVYCKDFVPEKQNKKYLFDKTSTINGISFYHMHGMNADAQSICLGYEHYAGIVQNLRDEVNKKENNKRDQMRIKKVLFGDCNNKDTWGERFYTSDIDILGFSLESCEIDIWWLLTHRASLYYSNYCGIREKLTNTINYYDIIDDVKKTNSEEELKRYKRELDQRNKHSLLTGSHVNVKKYLLSENENSYECAYRRIIDDIKHIG